MLLLSQLLLTKESFESCKIQVFCIAEEEADAEGLKVHVAYGSHLRLFSAML